MTPKSKTKPRFVPISAMISPFDQAKIVVLAESENRSTSWVVNNLLNAALDFPMMRTKLQACAGQQLIRDKNNAVAPLVLDSLNQSSSAPAPTSVPSQAGSTAPPASQPPGESVKPSSHSAAILIDGVPRDDVIIEIETADGGVLRGISKNAPPEGRARFEAEAEAATAETGAPTQPPQPQPGQLVFDASTPTPTVMRIVQRVADPLTNSPVVKPEASEDPEEQEHGDASKARGLLSDLNDEEGR